MREIEEKFSNYANTNYSQLNDLRAGISNKTNSNNSISPIKTKNLSKEKSQFKGKQSEPYFLPNRVEFN